MVERYGAEMTVPDWHSRLVCSRLAARHHDAPRDAKTVRSHTRRLRMPERQHMTTRLKTLFQRPALFVLAGGINPIGAKMAEALGYDAFYMSGGNTSAHQLGWPDSGTSMRDMVDHARKIVLTVQIPVFADADTGYGDAISTHYTVREYIQAGIAAARIEFRTVGAEVEIQYLPQQDDAVEVDVAIGFQYFDQRGCARRTIAFAE